MRGQIKFFKPLTCRARSTSDKLVYSLQKVQYRGKSDILKSSGASQHFEVFISLNFLLVAILIGVLEHLSESDLERGCTSSLFAHMASPSQN